MQVLLLKIANTMIPWYTIVQCDCYSHILAPLIVCTPVLRVSMEGSDEEILWAIRKQLLWSASPVSEWSCFSVCWAGLGWAGLAGLGWCIQTSPPAGRAPHTCCGPVMSTPAVISSPQHHPPRYSCQPTSRNTMDSILAPLLNVDLLTLSLLDLCGQVSQFHLDMFKLPFTKVS